MSTKSNVLTLFLNHQAPQFISGEEMAQQLSVSRTAIWKAVNELKKEGHLISSIPSKGYQYQPSDILSAEGIQLHLAEETPAMVIKLLHTSASTMNDAKLAALNGEPANTLIVADTQEAPKGRFGRPFFAKQGGGIYMSILLRPNQTFAEMAQYTTIMGVAIAETIERMSGQTTQIKWVNDIYMDGKQVCGILSEAMSDVESGQITNVIIGMGINFSIHQQDFPEDLQEKATSVFRDTPPIFTRNELIAGIWNQFYEILSHRLSDYMDTYRQKSFVLGKDVTFVQGGETFQGRAATITDQGELVVQLNDGQQKSCLPAR